MADFVIVGVGYDEEVNEVVLAPGGLFTTLHRLGRGGLFHGRPEHGEGN